MRRILSVVWIAALLTAIAGCAPALHNDAPVQAPSRTQCVACKDTADCGGGQSCFSGCCGMDDENPLE